MNAGKAVYGILSANSGVTDIVGTNIFPEIAEQETAVPFIVYQLQSVDPDDTHDGPSKLDEVRFEFLCYADSYNAAADLGVAVRAALDRVSGTYNGVHVESIQFNDVDVNIEYDPRRYSQVLTFTFRIKRDDVTIALGTPVTGAVLGDLSDVDVTGVTNGQLIAYNSTSGNWEAADDAGGANELNDLSDASVSLPTDGEVLIYSGGEFVNDNIAISNVTNLQSELDATPDSLDDLTDVKIVGTPQAGEALVYSSGFWQRGTAGASTLGDLTDVNTTGAGVGSLIQYNGASWDISAAELPSDALYYHNRYASEAETLLDGATDTVELYYTAQADGDGLHEDAQTDTATTGYDIRRKLYYAEKAQADPNTSGDWTQFADIADDTTYASAKATLLAYLKARTGGTVPISLKMTWEEVAEAPTFTGLLNESYGSGAAAAYSVRRLNGNYTGAAIQVERSSDNTTQDIGFDANGDLDESALTTFCTGTTCKVRTWYDQSQTGGTGSGNDAVQTTHANQPTIYTGGAIVKENGRVAMDLDGTDFFDITSITITQLGFFNVTNFTHSSFSSYFGDIGNGDFVQYRGTFYRVRPLVADMTGSVEANKQSLVTILSTTSNASAVYNSGQGVATGANASNSMSIVDLFSIGNGTSAPVGTTQEFILYDADKSTDRTSIESNIGDYFTQNTPLLDTYTGAAAAFSLRKLSSSYSGSAIRVRRASDNAESDIGFNVFGELSTVELAAFCGSSDGFVKTWYCQSGNANDATQTTAANQPKIYDSSTGVVTRNGKPFVMFSTDLGGLPHFQTNHSFTTSANDEIMISTVYEATTDREHLFEFNNIGMTANHLASEIMDFNGVNCRLLAKPTQGTALSHVLMFADGTDIKGRANGAAYATDASDPISGEASGVTTSTTQIEIGRGGNAFCNESYIAELILYPSYSAIETGLESNINTFYDIY